MRAVFYGDFFPRLFADMRRQPGKWVSRLIYLLGPWITLWMVEILNENDVFTDLQPWQVLMNLIWYYLIFAACRLIFGRRKWAATAAVGMCFAAGLLNHYILRFRGRILFPADLSAWRTAANVADGFDYSMDFYMQQALIVAVAYLFLVWVCPGQKRRDRMPGKMTAALILFGGVYSFAFFGTEMLPALGIYTQQWSTQANGFLLNFTVAVRNSSISKPDEYSEQLVLELKEQFPEEEADPHAIRPTNIVVVMNEAFSDLTIFDRLNVKDPTPFLHSMEENTIKGLMYSPVTGGGTASVEYEYLTGFSTLFQPPHTVAYQLYVEEDTPALSSVAGEMGYGTTAFHPYDESGWNRTVVYEYLDFDEQLYDEDVEEPHKVRNYISDRSSYEKVFEITQEAQGEPCFVFNVTMQNHSGYAQGWLNLPKWAELDEELEEADPSAEQYLSLMRESDRALEELIGYYSNVEEPTMVVFFGDHQPSLTNDFYEVLYGKPLSERNTEELLKQYAVPFFIWTNYDIEERQDVAISANYLGVLTAQTAGLPLTGYMSFLAQMYEEIPVVTPAGFITGDGACLTREELSEEQQEWIDAYEVLNYCGVSDLFEEAYDLFHLGQQE